MNQQHDDKPIGISIGTAESEDGTGYIGVLVIEEMGGHFATRIIRATRAEALQDAYAVQERVQEYVRRKALEAGFEVEFTPQYPESGKLQ